MNGANIFNGMFGRVEAGLVRLDVHGNLAVHTTNGYKSYSTKSKRLINCDSFVFDIGEEFFFVIPTNKVEVNDIILATGKNGKRVPKCVIEVNDTYITVINYEDSVVENILPERHVFMGNTYFYGKIVSMFGNNFAKGKDGMSKMMSYMMMSEMLKGNGTNSNNGMSAMLPFMMMNGSNGFADMFDGMFDFDEDIEDNENEKENE